MHTASVDDYSPASEKLSFPAGSKSGTPRCITIKITADSIVKNEETIQVAISALSLPHGVSISPLTSTTVRIIKTKTVTPPTADSHGNDGGDERCGGGSGEDDGMVFSKTGAGDGDGDVCDAGNTDI